MLKSLFSSSIRAELLELLLNSPEEKFYVREAAKLLKKNPSGVKRELDRLQDMGIVSSERVANLRYFRADKNSPLFSELKDLIAKSIGLPGAVKSLLKANGVTIAFLHGPYAEGAETDTADLIAVGTDNPAVSEGLREIGRRFGKKIVCDFINVEEYRERKNKDAALKRVIKSKRIALIGRV